MIIMAAITTAELADALETDPRTVRKFLRSEDGKNAKVGKGSRWSIEKREVASLRKRFAKWDEARKAPVTDETTPNQDDAPETPIED
jgi:hypothetical protein